MGIRIKTGDLVKVISGSFTGQTGKVTKVKPAEKLVYVEGLGKRTRHMRANMYRQGGKKEIQVGIRASKVALVVDEKAGKTSRIGQANNKEIK